MNITSYIDATYLKTPLEEGNTIVKHKENVVKHIDSSITNLCKAVVVRPEFVKMAKKKVLDSKATTLVATVISFPDGIKTLEEKQKEIEKAIKDGVDEVDVVLNYNNFIENKRDEVKKEVYWLSKITLENHKTIKWIIEIAALNKVQIIQLTALIKNEIISNFKEDCYDKVFIKTSTGYFKTNNDKPSGATIEDVKVIIENAFPLPVKASGGIKTLNQVVEYLNLGVKRIGTSSVTALLQNQTSMSSY